MTKHPLGRLNKDDEFYTPRCSVEELYDEIHDFVKDKVIWFPFDTEESEYVKVAKERGYNYVCTHLWNGQDFYDDRSVPEKFDIIISNPPFSKKKYLLARVQSFRKPYALLYGNFMISSAGGSGTIAQLVNKCDIYFLNKESKFVGASGREIRFKCLYLTSRGLIMNESKGEKFGYWTTNKCIDSQTLRQ